MMDKLEQLSQPIDGGVQYAASDFIPAPVYSASDFIPEYNGAPVPITNQAMVSNEASTLAALSDDPERALQIYMDINDEYTTQGSSPTGDYIINKARAEAKQNDVSTITSIMSDPSYPDEFKRKTLEAWNDEEHARYKPRTILAEKVATSYDPKTEGGQAHQINILDNLDSVLEAREEAQAMLTKRAAKVNNNLVKDVAEMSAFWVAPFTEGIQTQEAMAAADSDQGMFDYLSAIWNTGSKREELQNYLRTLPTDQWVEAHRRMFEALDTSGISFGDFGEIQTARQIVEGDYTNSDKVLDNLFSMMDVLFLGTTKPVRKAIVGGAELAGKASSGLVDKINAMRRNSSRGEVNQTSVGVVYNDTNPEMSRRVAKAIIADPTGRTAQALLQTDQVSAVAHYTMPQVESEVRAVENIVDVEDPAIAIAKKNIEDTYRALQSSNATPEELEKAIAKKVNDLKAKVGVSIRAPMVTIGLEEGKTTIRGVYGPSHGEGGFASAEEAMEVTKHAFRNSGLPESSFHVLEQSGTHFTRVAKRPIKYVSKGSSANKRQAIQSKKLKTAQFEEVADTTKSYLVQVDYDYQFNPSDIKGELSELAPERTALDRMKYGTGNQSSITRSILDPSSIFHPFQTATGATASNKTSYINQMMLKVAEPVAKEWSKLPDARKTLLKDIIEEANFVGKKPSTQALILAGLSKDEIGTIRKFERFWEFEHHIKNMDKVHTSRSRGNKLFVDTKLGTQLEVKPVSQEAPQAKASVVTIYDHETGVIRKANQDEVKEAYESGGGLAKVDGGILIDDAFADYVLSKNTSEAFIRDIHEYDELLNKREAYYPVKYLDPHFIVRKIRTEEGDVRYIRIATADNSVNAQRVIKKAKALHPDAEFEVFPDMKAHEQIIGDMRDNGVMGRLSSQKIRGTRLQSLNKEGELTQDSTYIMNPVDTMIHSSRVLAERAGMRSWLELAKQRYLQRYGEYVEHDEFKQPTFPSDISQIAFRERGAYNKRLLGDAKAEYNYINTIENGYVNLMDEGTKGLLLWAAEIFGDMGIKALKQGKQAKADAMGRMEVALREASKGANQLQQARRLAFSAFLALNPLRQFFVQANQAVQAFALYPREFKRIPVLTSMILLRHGNLIDNAAFKANLRLAGITADQAEDFYQAFIKSGLVASIDNHNIIGASLRQLTEAGLNEGKLTKAVMVPARAIVKAGRRAGFDAGEFVAKASSFSAAYANQLRKTGKTKFTQRELDAIAAEADLLTLSMNRAGEMPWNQNTLSLFFQFQSAAYKQMMLMTLSRRLEPAQKVRLGLANLMMYGIPSVTLGAYLRDNDMPVTAEMTKGLGDFLANALGEFVFSYEDSGTLDFQGTFAPVRDPINDGIGKVVLAAIYQGPAVAWQGTPAGALFDPEKGRLANIIGTATRFSGNWSEDAYEGAPDGKALLKSVLDFSSGTSYLFQSFQYFNGTGKVGPDGELKIGASDKYALAQAFGIRTDEETRMQWVKMEDYTRTQKYKDDVTKFIGNVMKDASASGIMNDSPEFHQRVLAAGLQAFGNDKVSQDIILRELKQTAHGRDWFEAAYKATGHMNVGHYFEAIRAQAHTPEEKQKAEDFISSLKSIREDMMEKD